MIKRITLFLASILFLSAAATETYAQTYAISNYVARTVSNTWTNYDGTDVKDLTITAQSNSFQFVSKEYSLPFSFRLLNTISNKVKFTGNGGIIIGGSASWPDGVVGDVTQRAILGTTGADQAFKSLQTTSTVTGLGANPNNVIEPWAGPSFSNSQTTFKYTIIGSAPNRRLIFQTRNKISTDGAAQGDWQVILFEGGLSTIQFNYRQTKGTSWAANTFYGAGYNDEYITGIKITNTAFLSVSANHTMSPAVTPPQSTSTVYNNAAYSLPTVSYRIVITQPNDFSVDGVVVPADGSTIQVNNAVTPTVAFTNQGTAPVTTSTSVTFRNQIWRLGENTPVYRKDITLTGTTQVPGNFVTVNQQFPSFTPTNYGIYYDTAYVLSSSPLDQISSNNIYTSIFTVSPPNNLQAVEIVGTDLNSVSPTHRSQVNVALPFVIRFRNIGSVDQINVPFTAVIRDPNGKIVYRDTQYVASVPSLTTTDVTFKDVTFNQVGDYSIEGIVIHTADQLRADDTVRSAAYVRYELDVAANIAADPTDDALKPFAKRFKPTVYFSSAGVEDLFDIPARVEIRRCSDGTLIFRADSTIPELNVDAGATRFSFPTSQGIYDVTRIPPGCYTMCGIVRYTLDGDTRNDTVCSTFSVLDRLKGEFEVGVGHRFETLSEAVDSMRFRGIGGNVTLLFTDEEYTEDGNTTSSSPWGAVDFRGIEGTMDTAVITFRPKPGVSPTITFTGNKPFCMYWGFHGPSFMTFDGDNTVDRRPDTKLIDTARRGITIINNGVKAGSIIGIEYGLNKLTFKNLNLVNNGFYNNDSSSVVRIYNEATKQSFVTGIRDTSVNRYLTIDNCELGKAKYGILDIGLPSLFSAGPALFFDRRSYGDRFTRNKIGTSVNPISFAGISLDNEDTVTVTGNQISHVNAGLGGYTVAYGIHHRGNGNITNSAYDRNTIRMITGGSAGVYGIYMNQSSTVYTAGTGAFSITSKLPVDNRNHYVNNAIYDLRGPLSYPIYLSTAQTLYMPGKDSVFNNSITTRNAKMNIFVQGKRPFVWNNIIQNTNGAAIDYSNYVFSVPRPLADNVSSDYNLFDLRGKATFAEIREYVQGTLIQNRSFRKINDWRTFTQQDVHSVLGDPIFISDSLQTRTLATLHLPPSNTAITSPASKNGAWLYNSAQFLDIDADQRQAGNQTPDIGADEFNGYQFNNDLAVTAIFKPSGYSLTSDTTFVTAEMPLQIQALVKNLSSTAVFGKTVTATLEVALPGSGYSTIYTTSRTLALDINEAKVVDFPGYNVGDSIVNGVFRVRVVAENDQNNNNNSQQKEFRLLAKRNALIVSYESSTAKGKKNLDSVTAALRRLGVKYDSLDRKNFATIDVDYTPWWTVVWASGDPTVPVNGFNNNVAVGGLSFKTTEELVRFLNAGRPYARKSLILTGQNTMYYNDFSPINNTITDREFTRSYLHSMLAANYPNPFGYTGTIKGDGIYFKSIDNISAASPDVLRPAHTSPKVGDSVVGIAYTYAVHDLTPNDSAAGTTWHGPNTNVVVYGFDWADAMQSDLSEVGSITSGTTRVLRGALDFIQAFRGVALPVEFTSISAEALKTGNQITFSVSEEKDVHHYELEVLNANNTWQMVASEKAASQAASQKSYVMMDNQTATGSYTYRVVSVDLNGTRTMSQTVNVSRSAVAQSFSLEQNYPNPFNPSTTIRFTLADDAKVTLRIMDVTGKVISTEIMGENMTQGNHSYDYKANGITSGTYVYELTAQSANGNITTLSKKMTLSK